MLTIDPQTTLDKIHGGASAVTDTARCLSALSGALYRTGNTTLANELDGYANRLISAANDIRHAHAREVSGRVAAADQASRNMLNAAIAATSK